MTMTEKKYDLVLFGVTGFTGKLAAEYLLQRTNKANAGKDSDEYSTLRWAVSARNQAKAEAVLETLAKEVNYDTTELPPILKAELLCETDYDKATLRDIVSCTKIVLTCSGPFELYGKTLVEVCAALGVHYADITGETDFVRHNIEMWDAKARATGACIVSHCGNDCIPNDLLVWELHQFATSKDCTLSELQTYQEFGAGATMSGGTLATAKYQLGKDRSQKKDGSSFDPLLMMPDGSKSEFAIKNASPKGSIQIQELEKTASPWIMGPVMVNCVKRSNALLGYAPTLKYGDSRLSTNQTWAEWGKEKMTGTVMVAAVALPSIFGSLGPKPGEGPSRETMEAGSLKLHAIGTMREKDGPNKDKERKVRGLFQFNKDIGYLYTAVLLVETGMALLAKSSSPKGLKGGCQTPASALGSDLTQRILKEMDTSMEVTEMEKSAVAEE